MYLVFISLIGWIITQHSIFLVLAVVFGILQFWSKSTKVYSGGGFRESGEADKRSKNWVDSLSLVDPRFNIREVAKQMILLEDHLFHENKHCLDCISKHTLFIEGMLEEAITMDKKGEHTERLKTVLAKFKDLMPPLIRKMKEKTIKNQDYKDVADQLRQLRKPLAKEFSYFVI